MRVVNALTCVIQERPFDMDADNAGDACVDRRVDGVERNGDILQRGADERWEKGGCAIGSMCRADTGYTLDSQAIVEKDVAAAIHLRVDKAGNKPALVEIDRGVIRHADRADRGGIEIEGHRIALAVSAQDATIGKGQTVHRVSVTLRRKGGWSGSRPRARASRSAAA